MEQRIGIIAIIVEEPDSVIQVNQLLHDMSDLIVGRMGLPKVAPGVSVISLVVLGENNRISTLSGKLGQISGVSCSTVYSKHRISS